MNERLRKLRDFAATGQQQKVDLEVGLRQASNMASNVRGMDEEEARYFAKVAKQSPEGALGDGSL